MRPALGISLEALALVAVLAPAFFFPPGPLLGFYLLAAQLLSTYLVHCPAHYLVGSALGIKFEGIRLRRSTLARSLPPSLRHISRLFRVPTLAVSKPSLRSRSGFQSAVMYASGAIASVSSAIAIAAVATWVEPPPYAALTWAVASVYLLSDLVMSPRSGDISRARAALR